MMVSALELRIALVLVALLVVIVFYVWYRANRKDVVTNSVTQENEDFSSDIEDFLTMPERNAKEDFPDDLRSEFQTVSKELREEKTNKRVKAANHSRLDKEEKKEVKETPQADKELLIVMHVVAKPQSDFTGPMVKKMMLELDLQFGEMGAYHFNIDRLGEKKSVYFVLNMFNPGSFEPKAMADFKTRGLTLILQLPGPEDSLKSFNIMSEHAQRLAIFLNGDLLDQDHNQMTAQALTHYKEQVQLFGLRASRISTRT